MVNHYERHDVFAGTPALKGFRVLIAKATSPSHTEHGHRKIVAIMELAVAFFHADMEGVIYAHSPAEAEPDRTVGVVVDQSSLRNAECGSFVAGVSAQ